MRRSPLFVLALTAALVGCGKNNSGPQPNVDTAERERIANWMKAFDQEYDESVKKYGIGDWALPGDNVDRSKYTNQKFDDINCENLAPSANDQFKTSGGQMAQVRALWLYTNGGCAGDQIQAQAQALSVLEGARRQMVSTWNRELEALPGSIRIEFGAGSRAQRIEKAMLLGVSEYTSCLTQVAGTVRQQSKNINFGAAGVLCNNNSQLMARYGACPVSWRAMTAHSLADQSKQPRDDHAWVGDATARFRLAWRACDTQALGNWQSYVTQIPQHLKDGRLKAISAPNDPMMTCQSFHFSRLLAKYGPKSNSYYDNNIKAWCGDQFGIRSLAAAMTPPRIFLPQTINDTGNNVSWLYDPNKAKLRPRDWQMSQCMTNVSQKLSAEGFNVPNPIALRRFCSIRNGQQAQDYLSGKAMTEGRARSKQPPG